MTFGWVSVDRQRQTAHFRRERIHQIRPTLNSRAPAKSPRRVAFGAQIVIYIVIYMYNLQFATTCPELEAIISVSSNSTATPFRLNAPNSES